MKTYTLTIAQHDIFEFLKAGGILEERSSAASKKVTVHAHEYFMNSESVPNSSVDKLFEYGLCQRCNEGVRISPRGSNATVKITRKK